MSKARRLTDSDIEKAVRLLDGWTDRLTWDRYLAVLATELGHRYTKPAMHKQPRIIGAWEMANRRLRASMSETGAASAGDAAIAAANRRVERLRAQVERLEQENRDLLEQFQRWALNAARAGLTPEQLNEPPMAVPWKGGGGNGTKGRSR